MSKVTSHSTGSPWKAEDWPEFSENSSIKDSDVCIVGAGITGLTCAYLMVKAGLRVTVLEASLPGDGESGNTTAHLASALDDGFTNLELIFGEEGAYQAAESHRAAIDTIESICSQEGIDCGFERLYGYLFAPEGDAGEEIKKEYAAALRAGFKDLALLPSAPFRTFRTGLCLRFPNQAQFQPLLYLQGLTKAVQRQGGRIITHTEVIDICGGAPCQLITQQGSTYTAAKVVIATNTPFNNLLAIHTKQSAYRTYVLAFDIERGAIPKGLYWDTIDPYHYIRLFEPNDHQTLLLVGGEDHKTGQNEHPEICFAKLELWTRQNIREAGVLVTRWSGQIMEPVDSLAFIGKNPGDEGIFIATGDSGNGMTHGTIAGMLLTDLVQNHHNPWTKLYDPSRRVSSLTAVKEFIKQNLNVALQYRDYISPADLNGVDDIALDEGAIVRHGMHKLAVFRDHNNELHGYSAICPHLGCLVRWNNVEKTWDCPCHGSRFSCKGEVVNGPAVDNLKSIGVGLNNR